MDAFKPPRFPFHSIVVLLPVAAFGLLSVSGHLGGKMVFDNGIGVGRHRRRTRLPEDTKKIREATVNPDGFVEVAREAELREGETLRVDVNGQVLVIARFEDKFFAFQEFCTHRFGPLSEGCIHAGEIECPWHRSRFELSTGKVAKGPARLDLKVFPVKVDDGRILVSLPEAQAPAAEGDPVI